MNTRHVLAGYFGPSDTSEPEIVEQEKLKRFDLGASTRDLGYGIGKALSHAKGLNLPPTEVALDLLILAVHVLAADTRLSRRRCAQDGWTREIRLCVPVSDPSAWNEAMPILRVMLRFLTGDRWEIGFRPRPASLSRLAPPRELDVDGALYDGVSLYSGGLDSLIGALDEIAEGRHPLFVSYGGEGAVSKPQGDLFSGLREAVTRSGANRKIERLRFAAKFPRDFIPDAGTENTTRSRSFLFLALGAMAGSGFHRPFELRIPENGFIALNVPLDPTRLGSSTTRTTHPFYLHRWNDLLCTVGIPGTVVNPYWHRTKGEMVAECKSQDLLDQFIAQSVSCAHPSTKRFAADDKAHCGTCVPCLIRRAAIKSAWNGKVDPTGYRYQDLAGLDLDAVKASGQQVRGFQFALARLETRPSLASILIHKPGPLREDLDKLHELAGMYSRGMGEVGLLLRDVRTVSSKFAK